MAVLKSRRVNSDSWAEFNCVCWETVKPDSGLSDSPGKGSSNGKKERPSRNRMKNWPAGLFSFKRDIRIFLMEGKSWFGKEASRVVFWSRISIAFNLPEKLAFNRAIVLWCYVVICLSWRYFSLRIARRPKMLKATEGSTIVSRKMPISLFCLTRAVIITLYQSF